MIHPMKTNKTLLIITCFILLVALLPGCISYNGEKLFQKEGCSTCHRFKGKGGNMGPDLTAITEIRNDSSIESYLKNPKQQNHYARMPSFDHLSWGKRRAIIAYLKK
jgi:cytochrome c2